MTQVSRKHFLLDKSQKKKSIDVKTGDNGDQSMGSQHLIHLPGNS